MSLCHRNWIKSMSVQQMSSRIHHLLESVSRKCNRIPRKFEFRIHRTNEVSWKVGTPRTRWFVGINIKSPWSLAHVVRRDHVHRARNADYAARVYEGFVKFHFQNDKIIKHWRHIFGEIHEVRKDLWAFFLDCAFRMLIGRAGKLRSYFKDYLRKTAPLIWQ